MRVQSLQGKLYQKAKQEKGFKFYVLYDKVCSREILEEAYRRVKKNNGCPGIDKVSFDEITDEDNFLADIESDLKNFSYKPSPVLRVMIPKANGKMRPLGIPTIKDRVVQMAVKLVIEPIFEADFVDSSYGFRPKRSAKDAIKAIKSNLQSGKTTVLDADLSSYFDTIPHDKLLKVLKQRISDKHILKLIMMWLKAPIADGNLIKSSNLGTPQGGVISPLLSNIYLNVMDKIITNSKSVFSKEGVVIVRYADDFVLMSKTISDKVMDKLNNLLEYMGLKLNQEKTKVVNAKDSGFDFLGFNFSYEKSLIALGKYWNVKASKKSLHKLKMKLKNYLKPRIWVIEPILVKGINEIVRGWFNYFKIPSVSYIKRTANNVWEHLNMRLSRLYNRKSQKGHKGCNHNKQEMLVKRYKLIDLYEYAYGTVKA
jgi:RNA-directed DNA polymerase